MSDAPVETAPAATSPESTPPPAASAAAAGDGDPFAPLPESEAIFPRSYVEKLRNEGHKYRTEAQSANQRVQEYEDVFGVYPDEDRQVWMDLARTWAIDPAKAAGVMDQIAKSVLTEGEQPTANGDAAVAEELTEAGEAAGLTPQQVEEMIAQALAGRDQAAAEQKMVETIYDEVRKHGYEPESKEGIMLLWTANNETEGDIEAAVAKMQEFRQGIIDDYVAGRATGAQPRPTPQGVAASEHADIDSFEEARRATDQYLRSQGAAST